MNKFIELFTDRKGKLSIYKLSFFVGANTFLIGWSVAAIASRTVPEIPNSISLFLGVLGSAQLGGTFLSDRNSQINKENQNSDKGQ